MPRSKRARSNNLDAPNQSKKIKIGVENDAVLQGESSSLAIDTRGDDEAVKGVEVGDGDVEEEIGDDGIKEDLDSDQDDEDENEEDNDDEEGEDEEDEDEEDEDEDEEDEDEDEDDDGNPEDRVQDTTHFRARNECSITRSLMPLRTGGPGKVRLAFSGNEEEVYGVETLCARVTSSVSKRLVGCMKSLVVERNSESTWGKDDFRRKMDEMASSSAELAYDLFDRRGCLKKEFIEHPVRKGTGVWGREIEDECFMVIESIEVAPSMMRQSIARRMWSLSFIKALGRSRPMSRRAPTWVFVSPSLRRRRETLEEYHHKENIVFAFWRSCGFRRVGLSSWFCYATDSKHASHSLPIEEDLDPPKDGDDEPDEEYPDRGLFFMSPYELAKEKLPFHYAVTTMSPESLIDFLQSELAIHSATAPRWTATDNVGNTILHLAAAEGCAQCVTWIRRYLGTLLDAVRNHRGFTPLENLKDRLDDLRDFTQLGSYRMDISHKFRGFPEQFVLCLLNLKHEGVKINSLPREDIMRETVGCDCGQCIEGVISPRIMFRLFVYAKSLYEDLHEKIEDSTFSFMVDVENKPLVSASVKQRLKSDETWRIGYYEMFTCIAACLNVNCIPTPANVIQKLKDNTLDISSRLPNKESAAAALKFLEAGGHITDILRVVFGVAKSDYDHLCETVYKEAVEEISECRNDFAWSFAAAWCGIDNNNTKFDQFCTLKLLIGAWK